MTIVNSIITKISNASDILYIRTNLRFIIGSNINYSSNFIFSTFEKNFIISNDINCKYNLNNSDPIVDINSALSSIRDLLETTSLVKFSIYCNSKNLIVKIKIKLVY